MPWPNPREVVMFISFIMVGLIPPFSMFFLHVLNFYHIHLVHLNPNSIIMLSTFTHLCEMFFGIPPNLHLFLYFYYLRSNSIGGVIGSCSFWPWSKRDLESYMPLTIRIKWDSWNQNWCYVGVNDS